MKLRTKKGRNRNFCGEGNSTIISLILENTKQSYHKYSLQNIDMNSSWRTSVHFFISRSKLTPTNELLVYLTGVSLTAQIRRKHLLDFNEHNKFDM